MCVDGFSDQLGALVCDLLGQVVAHVGAGFIEHGLLLGGDARRSFLVTEPCSRCPVDGPVLYVNLTQDHCDGLIRDHLGEEVVAQASS